MTNLAVLTTCVTWTFGRACVWLGTWRVVVKRWGDAGG